jgi:hypothetical protein
MGGSKFNRVHFFPWINLVLVIVLLAGLMFASRLTTPITQTLTQNNCPTTLSERVAAADVIVSGSVFVVIPGGSYGAQVIIDPLTFYKGRVDTPTLIVNARDDAGVTTFTSDDREHLRFQSGQPPYLLYLYRQADGTFNTRDCDGTRFLATGLTAEEQQLSGLKTAV